MAAVMLSKGVSVELEVRTNNGRRIDLLTNRYAIECKPTLTRDALLRAAAQMKLYASSFPNHEYVLAGISPRNREGFKAAHSTAVDIKKEFGYTIWFIDKMSYFADTEDKSDGDDRHENKLHTPSNWIDDVYELKLERANIDLRMDAVLKHKKSDPNYVAPPPVDLSDKPLCERWGYEKPIEMFWEVARTVLVMALLLSPIVIPLALAVWSEPPCYALTTNRLTPAPLT